MNVEIILSMAGGLGLFLFGMTVMSESIEKVAGAKLRSILEVFTTNRFTGLIVGIIFTGIIQSSSACTVMVALFCAERDTEAARKAVLTNSFAFIKWYLFK